MTEILNTFYEQFGIKIPRSSGRNIITVDQGHHAVGSCDNYFYTRKIGPCSIYPLVDRSSQFYGFYHSFPKPDLSDPSLNELSDFRNGRYRPVHGSLSTEKSDLESHITSILGIVALSNIKLNTRYDRFDALLSPSDNRLYISIPARGEAFSFCPF